MKIGDFISKMRMCSDGDIHFHLLDNTSRITEEFTLTSRVAVIQHQTYGNKSYPFSATLLSFDYVGGSLVLYGLVR